MTKNFRMVTDELFSALSVDDLAEALDCSVASIDQARLREGAKARRSPPAGWEAAAARLAEKRSVYFKRLADKIRSR